MWSGPKSEDTDYVRVKAMLKSLGLSVSAACACSDGPLLPWHCGVVGVVECGC